MDISSWNVLMLHMDECSRKICVKLHKNMDISSRNVQPKDMTHKSLHRHRTYIMDMSCVMEHICIYYACN